MRIELPDKTVRDVEAMLAKRGDVSEFIDRTLQRALFFETVRKVKRQNAQADPQKFDRLINEALAAVRADRRRVTP